MGMGNWLSAFTGSAGKKAINSSYNQANAAYDQGNVHARADIDKGYAEGKGYIDPIVQSGGAGGKMYRDTLGINGAEARSAAQGTYLSDDVLARIREQGIQRSGQVSNSAGGYNSGAGALADSRVNLENYGNWQNRLAGQEARGDQAAGLGANLAYNTGQSQADREMSYASAKAGAAVGKGAALATNENTGINNLLKLGGLGVQAYTGFNPANRLAGTGGGFGR